MLSWSAARVPFIFLCVLQIPGGVRSNSAACSVLILFPRNSAGVIHPCLICPVRVAVREMYRGMANVWGAPVFSGSRHLRIS